MAEDEEGASNAAVSIMLILLMSFCLMSCEYNALALLTGKSFEICSHVISPEKHHEFYQFLKGIPYQPDFEWRIIIDHTLDVRDFNFSEDINFVVDIGQLYQMVQNALRRLVYWHERFRGTPIQALQAGPKNKRCAELELI